MRASIILAALALSGCALAPGGSPPPPSTVTNASTLDEKLALGVESLYKVARTAAEFAVDHKLIKGERATQVAAVDNAAYKAVLACRAAYSASNATSYAQAAAEATGAIAALLSILPASSVQAAQNSGAVR